MAGERRAAEDEMEVRGVGVANNGGGEGGVRVLESENRKVQQQVQGPVVWWDRFLPFRSLKVLLVENDDCTRHVVSALLRNCSYEVVAVANGVQAWRYLEDLTNHTDLILTEVVMPVISGISLLYKIMSHKTIKNIPVIMMSSHDSMGIVFKCLSRGAVDFLVKPIRKNELKNLWQHVWRRCQSSSGSGSESGTESRKSVRCKSRGISNNSNHSNRHVYGSNDSSSDEDDEYESGAQSSWTKRAAEIGSPQPMEDDTNDAPDSTCAQVIHTKAEFVNGMENVNVPEDGEEEQEQFGSCKDKMLEQGVSERILQENQSNGQIQLDFIGKGSAEFDQLNQENQHAERISTTTTSLNKLEDNITEASNTANEFSCTDKVKLGPIELPFLGLRSEKEMYTCGASLVQDSQKDSSVAEEPVQEKTSDCCGSLVQLASGFIDKNGGSIITKLEGCVNIVETLTPQNAGHAEQNNCTVQPVKVENMDHVAVEIQLQPRESQQVHVEHHHHYHHYHHHIHDVQHRPTLASQDQCSFENPETVAASSHVFTETGEGATGNFSTNGSGSGSQHGSNGKDGSQHRSNRQEMIRNANNEDCLAGNSDNDIVNMNIITNRSEGDQFIQREAGLIRSRNKRKERSFEKQVKIQGRKKLADQRTCEYDAEVEDETMLDEFAHADICSKNVW